MKLRVSYSLLSLWRQGKYEEAINSYLHRNPITSKAIEAGRDWDTKIQEYVEAHKRLPDEFLGYELTNPTCQYEAIISWNKKIDVKGVFDIFDSPIIFETKTGSSKDSGDYANDFQGAMYLLLAEKLGLKVDRAIIIHFNQHNQKTDQTIIWKSKNEIKRAENFINTLAPEIYEYFDTNGILKERESILDKKDN